MRPHQLLVRLYPGAFRERWGEALEAETRAAGWRSWPGLILTMADLWLHPLLWPADSRLQRGQRAATLGVAAVLASAGLGRLAAEQGVPLTVRPSGHWPATACLTLLMLGLALVAPLPRLTGSTALLLAEVVVRRLGGPALLGAGALAAAHLAPGSLAATPWRYAVPTAWWGAIAIGAVQCCRVLASLTAPVLLAPGSGRLRLGLGTLAAATTLAGALVLGSATTHPHPGALAIAAGAALLIPAWTLARTVRDLRSVPID
ncbi:hypothetical protein [Kitasatospora sp. GAS204B]|uniref:hypothetical protein n=1 Tax=unclassified Kitasatospora TaxID=2633591 RepID=UPI00247385FE|nr:hypothetical protein [Kitasatospora sp. GAS204B]MDH6121658.1 hypothetical protein [Kitasatospora sp. GAS204B]